MRSRVQGEVTSVQWFGKSALLRIKAPEIAASARPGQFVHVLCGSDSPRLLRRPYSVFSAEGDELCLLIKSVGAGSRWLAGRRTGDSLDMIGPLGKGFRSESLGSKVALVGGGSGIAPLNFLALELLKGGESLQLFWGMEAASEFGELPLRMAALVEAHFASVDGSLGRKGTVIDVLEKLDRSTFTSACACGPLPMLRELSRLCAEHGLPLQVSLEERMACGVGACQGCAVPVTEDPPGYRMACSDGPVFPAVELDWERLG